MVRMKRTSILIALAIIFMAMQYGCGPKKLETVGYLSDYSGLEAESETTLRYFNPRKTLGYYSKFIIEPIAVHFHSGAEETDISSKELDELRKYTYAAIHNALLKHYNIVRRPGPGVARIRIAITDLKKSSPAMNIVPHTKLVGVGLGSVSMEGEVIDSITGEQIAAVIQSQKGKKLSLEGLSKWGDAKAVIDRWTEGFIERLNEAHRS